MHPETLMAPPRTWEELRADVQARTDRQVYPMTGMRSEDVRGILSHIGRLDRDAWGRAWSAMARAWIARGAPLEARDPEGAGEAYRMAWRYASFGGWPIAISPAKKASYQLSLEAFRRFGTLQAQPIETVTLSVPSTGPDADITVYLQFPAGRRPVPVLISIGGLDSYKEYVAERYGPVYLRSGLGYVAADAPHTGEACVDADERGERIYTAIIDDLRTRTEVDPARIGVQGVSLGGYWATKVAFAEPARLTLAVNWAGLLDAAWSPDQLRRALGSREYLFDLPQALCTVWGYETPEALVAGQSRMSIVRQGLVGRPTPRMLVVNGLHDSLVPAEDSLLLLQSGTPKSAWLNPGGIHLGRSSEWNDERIMREVIRPWIVQTMEQ